MAAALSGWRASVPLLRGLRRRAGPEPEPIVLRQRRIYILPTVQGLAFGAALLVMLIGSVNYGLSLGFLLTFLLAGTTAAALIHAFRNLYRLRVTSGRSAAVFAGERAVIPLRLENPTSQERIALSIRHADGASEIDVPALGFADVEVALLAHRRGWLSPGKLIIQTRYPLGVFRAWAAIEPQAQVLVYPHPELTPLPADVALPDFGTAVELGTGSDDFTGLREYHPGDSPRRIAWKAMARTDDVLTKQFGGRGSAEFVLDWSMLPGLLDGEAKLSRLTGWVLQAEQTQRTYSLRLPGIFVPSGRGTAHRDRCLKELATFDERSIAHG